MKQLFISASGWVFLLLPSACVKTEFIPETLAPQLTVTPATVALTTGQDFQLTGIFTDEAGADRSAQIRWFAAADSVAVVDTSGLVTGKTPGQTWVVATAPGGLRDSALITVGANAGAVARITITNPPATLAPGSTLQLSAKVYNVNNEELAGQTVSWLSSNLQVLTVSASGLATAHNAGAVAVTATVAGIKSLPLDLQVVASANTSRTGVFSGNSGYSVAGTATLQQTGNSLTLSLGSNFQSSNGPMLGVYLARNPSGVLNAQNSLKLGNLGSNSGSQQYAVPPGTGLYDYNYVVIYCIPFNVRFGTAQLGN